jgi:hypothetical protein
MQELYDPALADHHLAAQRQHGGHHLAHLPAPLGDKAAADDPSRDGDHDMGRGEDVEPRRGQRRRPKDGGDPMPDQLPLEEL